MWPAVEGRNVAQSAVNIGDLIELKTKSNQHLAEHHKRKNKNSGEVVMPLSADRLRLIARKELERRIDTHGVIVRRSKA
tara:strand:- start:304 stop:540 length:237 start_codon:yes stop_codon:yes gene_type:complete